MSLSFRGAEHSKGIMFVYGGSVFANVDANVKSKRRHECRRGTQECVRHNDFNSLRFFAEN
jgi:hypothetical protein